MSGWIARRFQTGRITSALCGLVVAINSCPSAKSADAGLRDDEVPPDLEYIRAKAATGASKAQTLLGDFLTTSGDFTNAVLWYRKAAEQNDVGAQLTLASCLVTGRGVAKNPAEAARWLREAARLIESPVARPQTDGAAASAASTARVAVPAPSDSPPVEIVSPAVVASAPGAQEIAKGKIAADSNPAPTNTVAEPGPASPAAFVRVQRAQSFPAATLVLQEPPPVVKSYPDSR